MKKVFNKGRNDFYYICILLLFLSVVTAVVGFLGIGFGQIKTFKIIFYIVFGLFIISAILGRYLNNKRRIKIL